MTYKASSFPKQARTCCAMQIVEGENGESRMGLLTQISPATPLEVCGPGFNEKTVKVRLGDKYYYVFREDIDR